jgi:hypothetical protein
MLVWEEKTAILQAVKKKEDNGNNTLSSLILKGSLNMTNQ